MTITVKPRETDPGYADVELHDGRLITWDFTIPEAEKHAQALRECDHEPTSLHGDGSGGWLCDACGALVEHDDVTHAKVEAALDSWYAEALKGAHDQLREDVKTRARARMRAALLAAAAAS